MSIPGFPTIEFPSDLKAGVAQLLESARGTDDSIRQCAAIDQATRASWGDFYIGLVDFTRANADPGVLDMVSGLIQRANSYQHQLFEWQKKIGAQCALSLPPLPPAPPEQQSPGGKAADAIVSVLKWATIAGATIGGVYIVGKAIALIPPAPARRV